MKCPYRMSTNKYLERVEGKVFNIKEETVYEDCYEEDCPLYDEDVGCIRVQNEGGEV